MSMISAQCDELRQMAASVGLAVPQAATLMMEAADTIWQLRDDLQRANTENAKLRELCGEMLLYIAYPYVCVRPSVLVERARELRVEVDA